MGIQTVRMAGTELTCRLVEPAGKVEGLVVLCHGFGASGSDLVGLGPELVRSQPTLGGHVAFAFPEAPLVPPEMASWGGRAWWNLDMPRLEKLMAAGRLRDLANENPEGLGPARRKLRATIDALLGHYDLPTRSMVVGGFSQGAMLATETTLRLEEAPAALVALSGTLLNAAEWSRRAPRRAGLPVFQSHGRSDPLLPFAGADALREMLTGAGLDVDFHPFAGEHTIPQAIMDALGEKLVAVFGSILSI